jgi:tetratricopeptide (TPR) repeat protein
LQERYDEAFGMFYKSIWNDAWQHIGFLSLARIAARRQNWSEAIHLVDQSLVKNSSSHCARHLKVILLRKKGQAAEAFKLINESLEKDPFNYGVHFEYYLALKETGRENESVMVLQSLKTLMKDRLHNYLEYALDYAVAGLYKEASSLAQLYHSVTGNDHPMLYYYMGWFSSQDGNKEQAVSFFQKASAASPDYCFPNKLEEILILKCAIETNPLDSKAFYYLGNLWYDKRQYDEAIECWERSMMINDSFPTVHRNLALAYFNKRNNPARSLESMQKAITLDPKDARVLMELDQLYKTLNRSVTERLSFLEVSAEVVETRDDLYLELITLYNLSGKFHIAKGLIGARKFHPWEGGEGKVPEQYLLCCTEQAKKALIKEQFESALEFLAETDRYPDNLGEGKLYGRPENDIDYLKGCAWEGLMMTEEARACFTKASTGNTEPVQAIFYNDPQPDKILYQGLAFCKLGMYEKAQSIFQRLISFGEEHMDDEVHIDYFAVSLPDLLVFEQDLQLRNKIHCEYLIALGNLGLGEYETAQRQFSNIQKKQNHHTGAFIHAGMIDFLREQNRLQQVPSRSNSTQKER